jgi:hypothetical protein
MIEAASFLFAHTVMAALNAYEYVRYCAVSTVIVRQGVYCGQRRRLCALYARIAMLRLLCTSTYDM